MLLRRRRPPVALTPFWLCTIVELVTKTLPPLPICRIAQDVPKTSKGGACRVPVIVVSATMTGPVPQIPRAPVSAALLFSEIAAANGDRQITVDAEDAKAAFTSVVAREAGPRDRRRHPLVQVDDGSADSGIVATDRAVGQEQFTIKNDDCSRVRSEVPADDGVRDSQRAA